MTWERLWLKQEPTAQGAPPPPGPLTPTGGKPTIKQFMAQKSPDSDMEAAAVVAYFLAENGGIKEIDKKLLSEWTTKAGRKPPKAPGQTLTDAKRKKGYFDKGSTTNKFKLSDTGRYLVEHELPKAKS